MEVRLEEHYGREVFVSVQAEQARKEGCLCVRKENGNVVMCRHLRANIKWEEKVSREDGFGMPLNKPSKEFARIHLMERAPLEMFPLLSGEGIFADDGVCRLALMYYALAVSGGTATATTRCPYYEAEVKSGDGGYGT